jgi:uncharacterized protein YaaN involved in tellurite resistance
MPLQRRTARDDLELTRDPKVLMAAREDPDELGPGSPAAPEPVAMSEPNETGDPVPMSPDRLARIEAMAADFVGSVVVLDPRGAEYPRRLEQLRSLGQREILVTSRMSSLLVEPARAVDGPLGDGTLLARQLADLRRAIEGLRPSRYDLAAGEARSGRDGPAGDRMADDLARYARARARLEPVVAALSADRAGLAGEVAALRQERRSLRIAMGSLRRHAFLAESIDAALERRLDEIEATDAARAATLRADVLVEARRRRQDLLAQLAIATQAHAALEMVEQSDLELLRIVETAAGTALAAMRAAGSVASALATLRLVAERLEAVDGAAGRVAAASSALLGDRSAEGDIEAVNAGVELAVLRRACDDVLTALDRIDRDKLETLEATRLTAWDPAAAARLP